jgi:hypothetical protein
LFGGRGLGAARADWLGGFVVLGVRGLKQIA